MTEEAKIAAAAKAAVATATPNAPEKEKKKIPPVDRSGFDEAISNMFSSPKYFNTYLFYAHVLAQCRTVFDNTMPAPAGVNFQHDHFNLYINTVEFNKFPLEQRLGILKHEMLHIINSHTKRKEDRDHQGFNIAADCAINQAIERKHLPKECIFPDQFPGGKKVPAGQTAEQYYEYIPKDKDGKKDCGGMSPLDDHSKWDETAGDGELQDDITKGMMDKSMSATQKARGNIPSEIAELIDILSKKRELNWKTVLRNIVGNKRVGSRKTITRCDRRLPNFEWLKGRTKDRMFNLLIVSDVSGSVGDDALLSLWGEVRHICSITNSNVDLVQVDTNPSAPEKLGKNTKIMTRKACGGTNLFPAIAKAKEHRIDFDAVVVTTDGYLCESDVQYFADIKKRIIWLIEKDGQIMDSMNTGRMKAFKLKT